MTDYYKSFITALQSFNSRLENIEQVLTITQNEIKTMKDIINRKIKQS